MTDQLPTTAGAVLACYEDARASTLALVEHLDDAQLLVPHLAIVNPLLWEIGHVAWVPEHFALRDGGGLPSSGPDADRLFASVDVAHDTRWALLLPSRQDTLHYLRNVLDALGETLRARSPSPQELAAHHLCILHEDMHGEALVYTRQTLG